MPRCISWQSVCTRYPPALWKLSHQINPDCLGRFKGQYEWDPVKAEANLCKHKISFETATKVLDDPNFLLTRGSDR